MALLSLWGTTLAADLSSDEAYRFAEALSVDNYTTKAIEYYEKSLKGAKKGKRSDDTHLALYKLWGKVATASSGELAAEARKKSEENFNSIQDSGKPEVQLERIKSDLATLKTLDFKLKSAKEEEKADMITKIEASFKSVAEVSDKIRTDARKWLDEFADKEEREQKKLRKEYQNQANLETTASLNFGEACVIYASAKGHTDPEVRQWLEKMAKGYEEFIADNYGNFAAIVGSIYYGQVCILLESFSDNWGRQVDGYDAGKTSFSEAIAGLELFGRQRNLKTYVETYTLQAYTKQAEALYIIGEKEEAIDSLVKLFEWKSLTSFKKKHPLHDQMMFALQDLCHKLLASYEGGNKDRVNDLFKFTLSGFNFTKKVGSRWHPNFRALMGKMPTDDPNVEETLDIAYMKGGELYTKARMAAEEPEKAEEFYFQSALKYKRVMELLATEEDDILEEFYPTAAYRLGFCYYQMDNYLLALSVFLQAIDRFPSTKYPEKTHPAIYKNILQCAKYAKASATRRYTLAGKQRFDQSLFLKALEIISEQFPAEGGDPDFWRGYLMKGAGDYEKAKAQFEKTGPDSKMYYKSQYGIVDCSFRAMKDKEKQGRLEGEELKKERGEVAKAFASVVELCRTPKAKPADMSDKDYAYMETSRKDTLTRAFKVIASLYYTNEEFGKTHETHMELLKVAENDGDRFKSYRMLVSCSYKLEDAASIEKEIKALKALKPDGEALLEKELSSFIGKALQMQANLKISKEMNPLINEEAAAKGGAKEAVRAKLAEVYIATADLLFESLNVTGDKDENMLKQVIAYYYTPEQGREKALEAINRYFEWYSEKPKMEAWYEELIGQPRDTWDAKLGGIRASIKLPRVEKVYDEFLDMLFDERDYSKETLADVKKLKRETGDRPRNYQTAIKKFEELEAMSKSDLLFGREGFPKLQAHLPDLKEANGYYNMRFMQADCYTLLKRYDDAADVFKYLASYYVEYPQIRIEMARSLFTKATPESLAKAKSIFSELLKVVNGPGSGNYNPKEYFSLHMWNSRTKLKLMGDTPPAAEVVQAWKYLRTNIMRDRSYFAKDADRFARLGIKGGDVAIHEAHIDELKAWVDEKIFPVLAQSGDPLADDSWAKILGEN